MPSTTRFQACLALLLLTGTLAGCAHGDTTPPGFTPAAAAPAPTGAGPGKSARPQTGS